MNIEIVTTKKALSKSRVKQMPTMPLRVARVMFSNQVEIIGFVRGVSKTHSRLAILKCGNCYYTHDVAEYVPANGGGCAQTSLPRGTRTLNFHSEKSTKIWIDVSKHIYQHCQNDCMQIYI